MSKKRSPIVKITENEMKLAAVRYVHQWATVNLFNLKEDFYECTQEYQFVEGGADNLICLNDNERKQAQAEFEEISALLQPRVDKYKKAIADAKKTP